MPAQTAVADSTTGRANPIRVLPGFKYVLPISVEKKRDKAKKRKGGRGGGEGGHQILHYTKSDQVSQRLHLQHANNALHSAEKSEDLNMKDKFMSRSTQAKHVSTSGSISTKIGIFL